MKKLLILFIFSFIFTIPNIFASGATFIYSSGDSILFKIDSNGNQIWSYTDVTEIINGIAVDLNGFVYITSNDDTVRKIDPNGNEIWAFTGHTGNTRGIAVDPNGNVFTASDDNTVRKLDSNGNEIWAFTGHNDRVIDIALDKNGFIYSSSADTTIRKIDSNGNEVWSFSNPTSIIDTIATDTNGFIYAGTSNGNVYKIDNSGNEVWKFTGHSSLVQGVAVDNQGFVYSASFDNTVRKIDSNGNQIWSYTGGTNAFYFDLEVDLDGFVYAADSGENEVKKIDPNGNEIWAFTGHPDSVYAVATSDTLPIEIPEPPTYDVELQTNTPYNDFIYQDDEINVITNSVITTILNDESFTVTSSTISTGSYTFNYWYDLDNMEIFTTDRNFTIEDPSRSYNLIADYSLDSFITFNLNSNLPTGKDFTFNTFTLENQVYSFNQTEFINYQHPTDRNWEIIAPTNDIGFYEFDYYYNNETNDIYTFNPIITGSGTSIPNLTAVYSLPEEYQINLIIESGIGNIIFQHGENEPISGPFISQTIGLGDNWTATAPSNEDYQFNIWYDLENFDIFSNNSTIDINNTQRDYYLEALYLDLVDITWDSNGGTPIPQQTVVINSSVQAPPEPTRPGFVFNRWEDSLGNEVIFPVTITEDVTFTADWIETYTLTYDVNGGGRIESDVYIEGATPEVVTPSRFGYTFEGWFTDDVTFQNEYDFTDPITQDITIHAKWAFGSDRDAELSLTTFLDDNDLGDRFSQIIVMITIYVFVNIVIMIYQAPLVVTLILNFIVTSLFMILGWIAIWLVVVIFMALFGFLYFTSSGRGLTE